MLTYIIIGFIVQLIVMVERAIRLEEVREGWTTEFRTLSDWVVTIAVMAFNVLVWPITLVCEIIYICIGI